MKPTISFNRQGEAVCGMIRVPFHDDDGSGTLQVSGFGLNPLAALRKAAEVATRVMQDPEFAALLPPEAAIVIKTARALTQMGKQDLVNVARNDETAPSAKKLASVLGGLEIGAYRSEMRRKYPKKDARYTPRKGGRKRPRPGQYPTPEVDQFGNPLDQYGNPLDQYGQPMPYDQMNPQYNPYAQQQQLPPGYGYDPMMGPAGGYPMPYGVPYPMPYAQQQDPYAMMVPPGSPQGSDQYFDDYHQQFAEQAWGANAFAPQDYGDADYMQDVGDDGSRGEMAGWNGEGCEPYCNPED